MRKNLLSALVVSGLLLSGAAFAADQPTPPQTSSPTATQTTPAKPSVATQATPKAHHKVAKSTTKHKVEQTSKVAEPARAPAAQAN